MTITIVLPFINLTGGIRVLLDYANALHDNGHRVTVVYPRWPYQFQYTRQQQWGEFRKHLAHDGTVPWFKLRAPLKCVPLIRSWWLPTADVIIAAGWPVAHDVAALPRSRGRKVLIVFHHESGTGPEDGIRAVYDLPFYRIAFSRFVKQSITSQFGCRIDDVVPNGIDRSLFYRDGSPESKSVLFLYHPDPRKGALDGLEAITQLKRAMPDINVRVCGTVRPPEGFTTLPFEFHPSDETLRKRYSQSSVLLYPSRHEGFALPPLEAMSCGCPPVTTNVGAVPEYASHDVNACIVPVADMSAMVGGVMSYLNDPKKRAMHASAAMNAAERFSLSRVAPLFENALLRAAAR